MLRNSLLKYRNISLTPFRNVIYLDFLTCNHSAETGSYRAILRRFFLFNSYFISEKYLESFFASVSWIISLSQIIFLRLSEKCKLKMVVKQCNTIEQYSLASMWNRTLVDPIEWIETNLTEIENNLKIPQFVITNQFGLSKNQFALLVFFSWVKSSLIISTN